MAGALRKTMLYLGLAEDGRAEHDGDGYEVAEDYDVPEATMGHEQDAQVTPLHRNSTRAFAQPSADLRRITTVHPRSYNDARVIGEAFRSGTPVIMNLSEMDDGDAKRLVDFSAGLIFGLHGTLERVTAKVFLLSPEHVEVTGEESTPQTRTGFFNQS